ncbi:MAG: MarR family transcriptional regulator [Geobacteraceae bacterium]|nr:MarR family transcriptional regulator [Geobacteraceae bacterium]
MSFRSVPIFFISSIFFQYLHEKTLTLIVTTSIYALMADANDFKLNQSIGYLITIAGFRYKGEIWKHLKPFDVTPEQWVVLNCLSTEDGVCQRELAERIVKDQPNTTRILDKMEFKGLIRRLPDPRDRRAFLVFHTAEGKRVREELLPVIRNLHKSSIKGFTDEEITLLKKLLERFTGNLS